MNDEKEGKKKRKRKEKSSKEKIRKETGRCPRRVEETTDKEESEEESLSKE